MSPHSPRIDPTPLLLAPGLEREAVAALLKPYGFIDDLRADANIQAMAGDPRARKVLAELLYDLLDAVANTADPDQALNHWERFLQTAGNRIQLFQYLTSARRMLHVLCTLFGNSPYLAQTLIRDPLLVYWLAEEQVLTRRPSRLELQRALHGMLANVAALELKLDALRRFKRREMLRIGVRDLLRLGSVPDTTAALSDLASVTIQAAYEMVEGQLHQRYGKPMHRDRTGKSVHTGFAIIGMGKLGGGELNYSSDVDLVYIYASDEGQTHPLKGQRQSKSIPNEEYFEYLARDLTKALTEHTQEGMVFRVDLRLRPEGTVGSLAGSLARYQQYYRTRGQGWERQAMLKAWPIAGDVGVGKAFLKMIRPFVFDSPKESDHRSDIIEQVKRIKSLIDEKMADRGHERRNVKLGIGGIREIEFFVQAVQRLYGARLRPILDRNTLGALDRFKRQGLLSEMEWAGLTNAYIFLRDVEHKLQMVHDLQTHALPDSPDELTRCAIRLGYPPEDRQEAMTAFLKDHQSHTALVNGFFKSFVEGTDYANLLVKAKQGLRRGSLDTKDENN
jgi:[glutamine synthetase] adenylyltransferase / [glutamine synthetase]-adenylyl-L-tyrosine phosphorylase